MKVMAFRSRSLVCLQLKDNFVRTSDVLFYSQPLSLAVTGRQEQSHRFRSGEIWQYGTERNPVVLPKLIDIYPLFPENVESLLLKHAHFGAF